MFRYGYVYVLLKNLTPCNYYSYMHVFRIKHLIPSTIQRAKNEIEDERDLLKNEISAEKNNNDSLKVFV